ncbi:hypothetical protein D922_00679 [Enterococcus faecalis 06-MB-DW-09]|nr:hypothetical protein D922_00679 [Enterococcus faecalis 06-MB-DW-09]
MKNRFVVQVFFCSLPIETERSEGTDAETLEIELLGGDSSIP